MRIETVEQFRSCLDTAECWNEDGDELFCSKDKFTRGQAKQEFAQVTGVHFIDIQAKTVWMKVHRREDWPDAHSWPWPEYDEYCVVVKDKNEADFECWAVS